MADTTTTSTSAYPDFAQPYAAGYLQRAQQLSDQPYQAYQGGRVAGMAPWQDQAYQAQATRAMQGSPVMSGANASLQGFFGQPTQGATQNPYGNVSAGSNPMMGMDNPYLTQQIDSAQGDLARNWNQVAAPQWAQQGQSSGSFGNSGVASAQALAMEGLQRNMGSIGQNMRFQDYTQQQQLQEANLNRGLQAQTTNAGLGESYAGRNDSMYNQGRGQQLSALGMAPQFAQQDYNDINQLQAAGAAYQGQNQKQMDASYQQYLDARQYPQQQMDNFGNALGRAVGNQGTQTSTQPGASALSQLFGGAITGASLYNLLGIGKP
jgi:hypothetical protein